MGGGIVKKLNLRFKVEFEGELEKPIPLTAYVFDDKDKLLAQTSVSEGQFQLDLDPEKARRARLFLVPSIPEGIERVTVSFLERSKAYKPMWNFEGEKRIYELLPIPKDLLKYWPWCKCRISGNVVRPVTTSEGATQDMPVCHARVHICEVDPIWLIIKRLPDDAIFRLGRQLLIEMNKPIPNLAEEHIPHPPEPDPGTKFQYDLNVMDPSPQNIAKMIRLRPQPEPPDLLPRFDRAMNLKAEPLQDIRSSSSNDSAVSPVSFETMSSLSSTSATIVRETLLANYKLLRHYICLWPWIWHILTCDEFAVVETDQHGRFDANIWYLCFGDHPDIYFWVEYCIGGTWTKVYKPYIRCNTYWNYDCGSNVTIRITDPRVPWCAGPDTMPGMQLAVMSIGNNISLHQIQGQSAGAKEGLTTYTIEGADVPLGGSIEPHVWFGEDLIAHGITHYRWSYRHLGSSSDWTAMDSPVIRHYGEILADGTLTFIPYPLGPDPSFPGQILFKMQPKNPPLGAGAISSSWAPMIDARENTATAFFLSHLLEGGDSLEAAGKYELKLELFDKSGKRINLTDMGILLKVPTIDGPFGQQTVPTVAPAAEHLIEEAGKVTGFRLVLHVDNNACHLNIDDVTVNSKASGPCGFIQYAPGSNAHISFLAMHPNNFAWFAFYVSRGNTGTVSQASAVGSVGAVDVNMFIRQATSVFSKDIPVSTLCGACDKAAFAETLHVHATATDGWNELDYLDAPRPGEIWSKAFALEPESKIL
jgi:hypothetical protein